MSKNDIFSTIVYQPRILFSLSKALLISYEKSLKLKIRRKYIEG